MLLPRNLVDQVAGVQEIGGGCTGQMVACLLLEKVGSPQPSSLIGTPKESFFVEQFFSPSRSKLLGLSWSKLCRGRLHQRLRKTSSAYTEVATTEKEMRNLTFTKNRLLKTEWRMFSQIQNEVVMDWAMGMEWWKSKDSADDVVVFKEDLILPHEYWVGRDGMVRPPQEHLPTLPQTPAHSGHCLLTRQSLHRKGENGMICHPSADLGQTGRKSGLLPLLSSLTIILSTSNPSALVIIIEMQGSLPQ